MSATEYVPKRREKRTKPSHFSDNFINRLINKVLNFKKAGTPLRPRQITAVIQGDDECPTHLGWDQINSFARHTFKKRLDQVDPEAWNAGKQNTKLLTAKKRKHQDPISEAALNALASASSSSSSEEEEEDDGAPTITSKKKTRTSPSTAIKSKSRRNLKPLFEEGDEVCSAWWATEKDRKKNHNASWHRGTIRSYREVKESSPYGPTRKYDIDFDDGDEIHDLEDHFVFPAADYELFQRNIGKDGGIGIGVRNEYDEKSTDFWARIVGWYVATIDGKDYLFSTLADAMNAYDNHVVQKKGKKTKESDLNLPEQWSWLFENNKEESPAKKKKRGGDSSSKKVEGNKSKSSFRPKASVESGRNIDRSESPQNRKRQKFTPPEYNGVIFNEEDRKYTAQVEHDGNLHSFGHYQFAAEAALAADKGAMPGSNQHPNFSNREEYESAISKESNGQSVDAAKSYEAVAEKVKACLNKWYAEDKAQVASKSTKPRQLTNKSNGDEEMGASSDESSVSDESRVTGDGSDEESVEEETLSVSDLKGIYFYNKTKKYQSTVYYDGKSHSLGYYMLASDAALASDEANRMLSGQDFDKTNFATEEDFKKMRAAEMKSKQLDVDFNEAKKYMSSKVSDVVSKIQGLPAASKPSSKGAGRPVGSHSSDYSGVYFMKAAKKYQSTIFHNRKPIHLGLYALQADAAFARDQAVKALKLTADLNFATLKEFEDAQYNEMRTTNLIVGSDSKSPSEIQSKVNVFLRKASALTEGDGVSLNEEEPSDLARVEDEDREKETADQNDSVNGATMSLSDLKGVRLHKDKRHEDAKKNHNSRLGYQGKTHSLGYYELASDAALAYDKANTMLRGQEYAKANFATAQAHKKMRAAEMKSKGLNVDFNEVESYMTSKINSIVSKIHAPSEQHPTPSAGKTQTHAKSTKSPTKVATALEPIGNNTPQANRKPSRLTGVTFIKKTNRYVTRITFQGKTFSVGSWALEADAALAYDKAAELLKGVNCGRINFSSRREYEIHRMKETQKLKQSNPGAPISTTRDTVSSIQNHLSKIPCPEVDLINDAIAKKWAQHLSSERGEEFIDSYRQNIDEVLGLRNEHPATVISNSTGQKVDVSTNPSAFFKPITEGDDSSRVPQDRNAQRNKPPNQNHAKSAESESDDNESLFSNNGDDMDISEAQSDDESVTDDLEKPPPDHNEVNSMSFESAVESAPTETVHPPASVQNKGNTTSVTEANKDQPKEAEPERREEFIFPIGCPVLWDLNDNSFSQGIIKSVATQHKSAITEYDVIPTNKSSQSSTRIPGKDLSLGLGCPVYVSLSDGNSLKSLEAKVLMCQAKACEQTSVKAVLHLKESLVKEEAHLSNTPDSLSEVNENLLTILKKLDDLPMQVSILKETLIGKSLKDLKTNSDHRISEKANKLVNKWKNIVKKEKSKASNHDTNTPSLVYTILIMKETNQFQIMQNVSGECVRYRRVKEIEVTALAENKQVLKDMKMPAQDPPEKQHQTQQLATENGSQSSSQQYFSSNSTITTVETDPPQRRRTTATVERDDDCRVYFPSWISRQKLLSYLRGGGAETNRLQNIGKKSRCTLHIVDEDHLLIQANNPGKYAIEDIRRAFELLENLLLLFVGRDGSVGRLWYDLGRSCEKLHVRRGSTAIMQRNPFSMDHEMGWMSCVELPFSKGERKYHGHFLIAKDTGILGRIKREAGGCEIKLCGNQFRVPISSSSCADYVWIMGSEPWQVDRAVEIIEEAIRHHTKNCMCVL